MAKHVHLAIGLNQQDGEIQLNRAKKVWVAFPKTFARRPQVQLTLGDSSDVPSYRTKPTTAGFWIKFKKKYTGEVAWTATQRM